MRPAAAVTLAVAHSDTACEHTPPIRHTL